MRRTSRKRACTASSRDGVDGRFLTVRLSKTCTGTQSMEKQTPKKKRSSDYLVIQLCTRQTGAFTTVSTPQKFSVWQPPLGCGVAEVWWVGTVGFDVFWGGGYFFGVRRACL
jgi:Tfp pilus assembly protein PilX